jgi:pyruvate ferredoxin oxidoreductase gamma subunit
MTCTLLGAFAALTGVVSLESVAAAIREKFAGETGERNVAAAQAAYDRTVLEATVA